MEVFNDQLKCCLKSIKILDKHTVELRVPDGECTDMTGATALAKYVLPTVKSIFVYNHELDTVYETVDGNMVPVRTE